MPPRSRPVSLVWIVPFCVAVASASAFGANQFAVAAATTPRPFSEASSWRYDGGSGATTLFVAGVGKPDQSVRKASPFGDDRAFANGNGGGEPRVEPYAEDGDEEGDGRNKGKRRSFLRMRRKHPRAAKDSETSSVDIKALNAELGAAGGGDLDFTNAEIITPIWGASYEEPLPEPIPVFGFETPLAEETTADMPPPSSPSPIPPTRQEIEEYRIRLENRLLERYNNLPEHAGDVAKVTVVLSKPVQESLDGSKLRAEFDQLVYNTWGKRIPELEKEYYVVVFGAGGATQVRSDPSIRVGLDSEKTYSERAPLAADPFKNVPDSDAFRSAPRQAMPDWWRPEM